MKKNVRVRLLGIFISIIVLGISLLIPLPTNLTRPGLCAIALLLSGITLWICESFPESLTCLLLISIAPWFGIDKISTIFKQFGSTSFFFVLATFAITASLKQTSVPDRIISFITNRTKGSSKLLILGFIVGSGFLSAIMSNIATTAMFVNLAVVLLDDLKKRGIPHTNFAKCLMIGIGYGACFGGFATPVGTPANLMAIELIETNLDITVRFIDWLTIGIPMWLLGALVCYISLIKNFPPEDIDLTINNNQKQPLEAKDIKIIIIIFSMMFFWILSSWITSLNTAAIAIIGMACMFLPGVDILDWKKFSEAASWNSILFVGGVAALVYCVTSTGASDWIVEVVSSNLPIQSPFFIYVLAATLACIVHIFIPTGSGVFLMIAVPFLSLSKAFGANPVSMIILISYSAGFALLLPFDSVPLLTYSFHYYSIKDMLKAGWLPTIIMILLAAILIPLFVTILQIS